MAIKVDYKDIRIVPDDSSENGYLKIEKIIPNAYVRILDIRGDKHTVVCSYIVLANAESNKIIRKGKTEFVPNLNEANFIAQAYDSIKALPEFAGAVDC